MEGTLSKNRPEALWKLQSCTNNIRTAASTVFTYLYCKIPYIYIQLLTFMVKLYLVVIAVIAGSNLRVATSHVERLLPIFLVVVSNCAYEGLLQVMQNETKSEIIATLLWRASHRRSPLFAFEAILTDMLRPFEAILTDMMLRPFEAILTDVLRPSRSTSVCGTLLEWTPTRSQSQSTWSTCGKLRTSSLRMTKQFCQGHADG